MYVLVMLGLDDEERSQLGPWHRAVRQPDLGGGGGGALAQAGAGWQSDHCPGVFREIVPPPTQLLYFKVKIKINKK